MPTPDQKRQAAAIFTAASEGKVIEWHEFLDKWLPCDPLTSLHARSVVEYPHFYRIAPDPIAPGHNPDKLTVSQVGEGWRLIEKEEGYKKDHAKEWWLAIEYRRGTEWHCDADQYSPRWDNDWATLRTRLSVEALAALDKPAWRLPDPPAGNQWHKSPHWTQSMLPDGYRPMLVGEKVHDETEMSDEGDSHWIKIPSRLKEEIGDNCTSFYRTTRPLPVFNPRDLPGFRSLLPTEQPHRDDFTEADLPEGCRPLLKGEEIAPEDEFFGHGCWIKQGYSIRATCGLKHRTRRPLPAIPRTRWQSREDVPKSPTLWLREKSSLCERLVICIAQSGVVVGANEDPFLVKWEDLKDHEYSLDRKTWAKCETTEAE